MTNIIGILGILSTFLVSGWAVFKYILMSSLFLDTDVSKELFDLLKERKAKQWVLLSHYTVEPKYPLQYNSIVYIDGIIFFFSRGEKLLTAGWQSKEDVSSIFFLRLWRKKIELLLASRKEKSDSVPVNILLPSRLDKLGELVCEKDPKIYLDPSVYQDIEKDVIKVLNKEKNKTSCLLYGAPGNGKTQFVKYLARKYNLPINMVSLNPEYSNHDLAIMFSYLPNKCIVLFEDFDNYFNKRECIIKNESIRFTFDSIINALDGVYNDYKQVIFIITANDINKIDESIKNRTSRCKFVKEFAPPTDAIRYLILQDKELVEKTKNYSLDQVFSEIN